MKQRILTIGLTLGMMAGLLPASAQKFEVEVVDFDYIKLPLEPLPADVKTYGCELELTYKESAEAEKAAKKEQRDKEMEAIENRSQAEKILSVLSDNKPDAPKEDDTYYPRYYIEQEVCPKVNIEGLNGDANGDVKIMVTMSGFTYSLEEQTKTTTKNEVKTTNYYYTITGFHPMTVITMDGGGMAVAEYDIPAVDAPFVQNTRSYTNKGQLEKYWSSNKKTFLGSMDKKLMDRNVDAIAAHLNDQHGRPQAKRKAKIVTVSSKKVDYDEYTWAFEKAFTGYHSVLSSPDEAKTNLEEAVKIWEEALKEVDPDNKKARINKKVAAATHINCAEAYCWLNDYSRALYHITKVKTYDVKKYEKQIASLKAFIDDHKARYEANK